MAEDLTKLLLEFSFTFTTTSVTKSIVAPAERVKLLMQTQDVNPDIPKDRPLTTVPGTYFKVKTQYGYSSNFRGNGVNTFKTFVAQLSKYALLSKFARASPLAVAGGGSSVAMNHYMAGGLGEALALFLVYPFEMAYTKQSSALGTATLGFFWPIWETFREHGFFAIYSGFSVALAGVFLQQYFSKTVRKTFENVVAKQAWRQVILWRLAASFICSAAVGILMHPIETIKRKLIVQTRNKERTYTGPFDCIWKTYKRDGIRGFFRGVTVNIYKGLAACAVVYAIDSLLQLKSPSFRGILEHIVDVI